MTTDELRRLWKAEPFVPFTLLLPEGRTVPVFARELAMISPDGGGFFAYSTQNFNLIDVADIRGFEVGIPESAVVPVA
jgi:hypothetical protein